MTLELYCRECALNCESEAAKVAHNEAVHHGFNQPPPNISQGAFDLMSTWSTDQKAHHCPVCLEYDPNITRLIEHVLTKHHPRTTPNQFSQTCPQVLDAWFRVVDRVYPDNLRLRILDSWRSDTSAKTCPHCGVYFPTLRLTFNHIFTEHHVRSRYLTENLLVYRQWLDHVDGIYPGQVNQMTHDLLYRGILDNTPDEDEDYPPHFTEPFPPASCGY